MPFVKKIVIPLAIGFGFCGVIFWLTVPIVTTKQYLLPRVAASGISHPGFTLPEPSAVLSNSFAATVLIQSFSPDGSLVAQAHGIVLTEDGLIAVPSSVIVKDSSYYQVVFDDRVARATVAAGDVRHNLVLVAIDETSLVPVDFSSDTMTVDQSLLSVVKHFTFGRTTTDVRSLVGVDLQHPDSSLSSGSVLIDSRGRVVGIFDGRQGIVIGSDTISNLFTTYVRKNSR